MSRQITEQDIVQWFWNWTLSRLWFPDKEIYWTDFSDSLITK